MNKITMMTLNVSKSNYCFPHIKFQYKNTHTYLYQHHQLLLNFSLRFRRPQITIWMTKLPSVLFFSLSRFRSFSRPFFLSILMSSVGLSITACLNDGRNRTKFNEWMNEWMKFNDGWQRFYQRQHFSHYLSCSLSFL